MWIPIVDLTRCVGCSKCVEACPEGAITVVDRKSSIDYGCCTLCGACDRVCQTEALKLKEPEPPVVPELPGTFKHELKEFKYGLKTLRRELRVFAKSLE